MNSHLSGEETSLVCSGLVGAFSPDSRVVVHCSDSLWEEGVEGKGVEVNTDHFDKRRFHGSLLEGIKSNLEYCLSHTGWEFCVVVSTRSRAKVNVSEEWVREEVSRFSSLPRPEGSRYVRWKGEGYESIPREDDMMGWMMDEVDSHPFLSRFPTIAFGPHEGLCLPLSSAQKVSQELSDFDFGSTPLPMEEIAAQTVLFHHSLPHSYLSDFPHWGIPDSEKRPLYKDYTLLSHATPHSKHVVWHTPKFVVWLSLFLVIVLVCLFVSKRNRRA